MKIALLGATRGTGLQTLQQALERGHQVTALARDVSKLPAHANLTPVQGDAKNAADVEKAIAGADAVISCIGSSTIGTADRLVSTCAAATVEAMKKTGLKRILFLSVEGAGENPPAATRMLYGAMGIFAKGAHDTVLVDKNRSEELLRASGLDFTFVRPPGLNDKPARGYRALEQAPFFAPPFVSRAAVAAFMLDELGKNEWVKKGVIVRH
jgi:putative NADH-flavin reductase